jgi:hypothetical protein
VASFEAATSRTPSPFCMAVWLLMDWAFKKSIFGVDIATVINKNPKFFIPAFLNGCLLGFHPFTELTAYSSFLHN